MRIAAAITGAMLIGLCVAPCGCSERRQTSEPAYSQQTPSRSTTVTGSGHATDPDKGLFGTTARAIGDIVTFPFRAVGEGLGQAG